MASERPNILWIMADHYRRDALRCYGSRWASSPHLDRVAAQGVLFQHCTTQSPVCVPSRTAQFHGRYPHALDVLDNEWRHLPTDTPLTRCFEDAGYQTASVGRNNYTDKSRTKLFSYEEPGPRPGGPAAATIGELVPEHDPAEYGVITVPIPCTHFGQVIVGGRYPLPSQENEPALLAKQAVGFLQEKAEPPFLLRVSFSAPHTPVLPASPYFGSTAPDRIEVPLTLDGTDRSISRFDAEVMHAHQSYATLSAKEVQQARGNFFDLCREVDAAVGTVLTALEARGDAQNTIVAFHSDHGSLVGEHGLIQNRLFYEGAVQVPWLLSAPGRLPCGKTVNTGVELIDFFPTLMELADVPVPDSVQARSVVPLATGKARDANQRATYSELDYTRAESEDIASQGAHRVMIREWPWKMFHFASDCRYGRDGALYNLAEDPNELVNLYASPEHADVVRRLSDRLGSWLARA